MILEIKSMPLCFFPLTKTSKTQIAAMINSIFDLESAKPKLIEVYLWRDKGKAKRESGREHGAMTWRSLAVDNLVWEQLIACQ